MHLRPASETFPLGDQTLSFEEIAKSDAQRRYLLEIKCRHSDSQTTDTEHRYLDISRRQDATQDRIATPLQEWYDEQPTDVVVESYEILEQLDCRRGEFVDTEPESAPSRPQRSLSDEKPTPGVDPDGLHEGDRVAYYVKGPTSRVYGYISNYIVKKAPSWEEGLPSRSTTITEEAPLDLGDRTKKIPLVWIIGTVDDPEVDAAIERRRDALH